MHSKQLKPLNQKRPTNGDSKQLLKPLNNQISTKSTNQIQQPITKKKSSVEQPTKPIKYTRSSNRPSTAIQFYQCDDLQVPGLEEEGYFETQIMKSIKTETVIKPQKPIPKNQVVLPKLEGDSKVKTIKDLEKQMDLEMSRVYDEEYDK